MTAAQPRSTGWMPSASPPAPSPAEAAETAELADGATLTLPPQSATLYVWP